MAHTYKDRPQSNNRMARFAREAHERARVDPAFALQVGFYLPEQEVIEPEDFVALSVKRAMEGR